MEQLVYCRQALKSPPDAVWLPSMLLLLYYSCGAAIIFFYRKLSISKVLVRGHIWTNEKILTIYRRERDSHLFLIRCHSRS
jgi:hypothetical protein